MRVLLTGITGFVGQNLMPMLLKRCSKDFFLTLNVDKEKAQRLFPIEEYTNFRHVSVADWDDVEQFNPEIVLHLATVTTSRNDTEIIHPMLTANIEFGVMLLDALSRCSAMKLFVNTGSFAEYRYGDAKYDSAYLYTATKTAFRSFVDYYSNLCGFKYVTAIPYSVYGGHMTVKRLIDYIRESMDAEKPVDMTKGEQVLDFIHVDDIARFYVSAIISNDVFCALPNGSDFHLGTGRGTSIRELAILMERKYGKKCNINWGGRPYRDRDIMYAVAPIAKNKPLIGWESMITLEEGC